MLSETRTWVAEPDITVVEISGRLNLGNSMMSLEHSIKRQIADGIRKMVFDLTRLEYIDSAGMGMVATCCGLMEKSGGAIRIAGAHGPIARSFDIIHMERIAGMDPDLDTACRHFMDSAG